MRKLQEEPIKRWIQHLRDIIYSAEDIIEGYRIQTQKLKTIRGSQHTPSSSVSSSCCTSFSSFIHYVAGRHQIGNKIESLNRKLDGIINDIGVHHLRPTPVDRDLARGISRRTSSVVEPDLVGERINDDTKLIVDFLISKENQRAQQRNISVYAIVGMGGIGKTTLAQKIFSDERLRANFNHIPPVWVCVSQDFSETELLRAIIKRAGGNPPGEGEKDREDLEPMLHDLVKGKKLFLVLDDVWDARVWENLLYKPLQGASAGSRVLVTTRHENVAAGMRAVRSHRVQRLSDEDGWALLSSMVFDDVKDVEGTANLFRDIGMEIVMKCNGLPLAIKVVAGALWDKGRRPRDWKEVLQNPAWTSFSQEGVMRVLYLSYVDLPCHLQQCFLYFALFPEDEEFQRASMIRLWIAEGFVEERENMQMEEVGRGYWKELVQRSLLQPQSGWYDSARCKMHDLVRSLACILASDECFTQDLAESDGSIVSSSSLTMKPRRVHIRNGEGIPQVIKRQVSLRTLLLPFHRNFPKDATTKLKYLRILKITNSLIDKLPDFIAGLVLLRYLDLSESAVREIPESIGKLVNLQYLILYGCKNMCELPQSVTNLQNLRCLDLSHTNIHIMPEGIGDLRNLVLLYGFWVSSKHDKSKGIYCNIGELGSLAHLNSLSLYKLESATSIMETMAAAFRAKNHLIHLELYCTKCSSDVEPHSFYGQDNIDKIAAIFEELCPPSCLEFIKIGGYFGLEYPKWMRETPSLFLPNLRRLELRDCVLCEHLPPLGLLPQLDCLWINGAPAIKSIGPELFGVCNSSGGASCPRSSFPKLEILHFENMPNFEYWNWLNEEDDQVTTLLPSLAILTIEGCPKLRSLPESLLCRAAALNYLSISDAQSLKDVKNVLHVEELSLKHNPCMEGVSNLPALKTLYIEDCKELKAVESLDALQFLDMRDSEMGFLPRWLLAVGGQDLQFAKLRRLVIHGNAQLLTRCIVDGPDWHIMQQIPFVHAYCYDELQYYIHYTKSPSFFDANLSTGDISQQQGRDFPMSLF